VSEKKAFSLHSRRLRKKTTGSGGGKKGGTSRFDVFVGKSHAILGKVFHFGGEFERQSSRTREGADRVFLG